MPVLILRTLQLMNLTSSEPGVSLFKSDLFQCQVFLNPSHMQSLHIKATPLNEKLAIQWSPDEVQTLEQFFDVRVAAPPYRPSLLGGYAKILSLPPLVLKDAIQIMRLDLMPELLQGFKWHVQLCMRVPPSSAPPIVPVGNPALLTCREKILIFVSALHRIASDCIECVCVHRGGIANCRLSIFRCSSKLREYLICLEWIGRIRCR